MEDQIKQDIEGIVQQSPAVGGPTLDMQVSQPVVDSSSIELEQPMKKDEHGLSIGWNMSPSGPQDTYVSDRRVTQDLIDAKSATSTTFVDGKAEGTVRPMDGSMGSPLFLDKTFPFPTVKPYQVDLPSLNAKVTVSTPSISKAVWDIARNTQGVPESYWDGYVYVGPEKDSAWRAFLKGGKQLISFPSDVAVGAVGYVGQGIRAIEDGFDMSNTTTYNVDTGTFSDVEDKGLGKMLVDWANEYDASKKIAYDVWDAYTDNNSLLAKFAEAFPSGATSLVTGLGAAKLLNVSSALGIFGTSYLQNLMENVELQQAMEEAGYSPTKQLLISTGVTSAKSALDSVSMGMFLRGTGNVVKQTARDAYKSFGNVLSGNLIKKPAGEAITEGIQGGIDSMAYRAITGEGDIFDTMDNVLLSALVGFGTGVAYGGATVRSEWNAVKNSKKLVDGITSDVVKNLHESKWAVVDWLMNARLFQSEADASAFVDGLIQKAPEIRNQVMKQLVIGELEKLGNNLQNNKEFATRLDKLAQAGGISEKALLDLDAKVESRLSGLKDLSASDKQFIKGLMRGVAFIMSFNGTAPSQLSVPYFRLSFDEKNPNVDGSYFDVDNNIINIDPRNVQSESPFDKYVRKDAKGNSLSIRQQRIIHEMAHYLDNVVGEGFGRYFEAYYGAIQSQFGWQRTVQIKNTAAELEDHGIHRQDPKPKTASPTHVGQTTEYFANALERAAQNTAEKAFGMRGVPATFVQYANLMLNGMNQIGAANEAVEMYLDSIRESVKQNGELFQELIRLQLKKMKKEAKGETDADKSKQIMFGALRLQSKLKRFLDADVTNPEEAGLSSEELMAVVQVLQGYLGKSDLNVAKKAFEGVDTTSLVDKARAYISEAYKEEEQQQETKDDSKKSEEVADDNLDEEPRKILRRSANLKYVAEDARLENLPDNVIDSLDKLLSNEEWPWASRFTGVLEDDSPVIAETMGDLRQVMIEAVSETERFENDSTLNKATQHVDGLLAQRGIKVGEDFSSDNVLRRTAKLLFPEPEVSVDESTSDVVKFLSDDFEERKALIEKTLGTNETPNKTFDSWSVRKVSGRTLEQDLTEASVRAKAYRSKAEKTPMLNKLFGTNMAGNVDMMLQAVGGQEYVDKYGITYARGQADQYKRSQGSLLETEIKKILVGKNGNPNSLSADAKFREFMLRSKMKSIEAEQINAADPATTEKVMLSPLEVMSIYATLKQDASKANLRIDKQYLGKARQLVSQLSKEQIAVAEAILKNLHEQWPAINAAIAEELGYNKYDTVKNYMPLYDAFYSEFKGNAPTALRNRSIEAEREMRPIVAVDMMQVFDSYTSMAGRTLSGFRGKTARLRNMLRLNPEEDFGTAPLDAEQMVTFADMRAKSSQLYSSFEHVLGEQGARNLVQALDDLLTPSISEGPVVSNAFDAGVSTIVSNAIAMNFLSWPKNFISNLTAAWGSCPNYFNYLMKTFGDLVGNIKETRRLVPQIEERFGGRSIDERLNAINATNGGLMALMVGKPKFYQYTKNKPRLMNAAVATAVAAGLFKKAGLKAFMHNGDAMGLAIGLTPMRLYLQEQGLSDKEVAQQIGKKVEELVSTSNVAIDPNSVRAAKRSPFGGLLMFTKDVQVKGQNIARTFMNAHRGEVAWSKAAGDIATIMLSLLAFSMISGGYWDALSDDDKVREDAMNAMIRDTIQTMFGLVSPIAGLASSVATYAAGVSGPSGLSTPAFVFMNNFVKDMKNGEVVDAMIDIATVLTGAAGATRLQGEMEGMVEAFLADTVEERKQAIMKAVGYSENMAKKRAGL